MAANSSVCALVTVMFCCQRNTFDRYWYRCSLQEDREILLCHIHQILLLSLAFFTTNGALLATIDTITASDEDKVYEKGVSEGCL